MIRFLSDIRTVLVTYMVFVACKLIYTLLYASTNIHPYLYGAAFIIYCLVSYWAYRKNRIALWFMIFSLTISGAGGLVIGAFIIPVSQSILKVLSVVLGAYFIFGSYILLSNRPGKVGSACQ